MARRRTQRRNRRSRRNRNRNRNRSRRNRRRGGSALGVLKEALVPYFLYVAETYAKKRKKERRPP